MVAGVWDERTVLGPWGEGLGHGNTPFDYRPDGTIAGLKIRYDISCDINSITFMNRTGEGDVLLSQEFGTHDDSSLTHQIVFTVEEYITGIDILLSSCTSYIKRLRVYTNKDIYRMDGDDDVTTPRIFIPTGGVVVGFFGSTSSSRVNSIGIYTVPYSKVTDFARDNKTVTSWTYLPQGLTTKIIIAHAEVINSIAFESKTNDGLVTASERFGGTDGHKTEIYILNNLGEFITEIDMMVGDYDGQSVVNFLSIHTNFKTYGPFGNAKGSKVKVPINEGSVVGFFGRAGMYLNSLDIFEVVRPKSSNYIDKCMSIGPFGGSDNEGNLWTYKSQDGHISEIVIRYGIVIDSIILQGKTGDGSVAYSRRFGGNGGHQTNKISFGPGEYIVGIDVMLGSWERQTVVYNLCICTNVASYGPFGTKKGTQLSIPTRDGRVVGFFGRSGTYLNAIGVHTVGKTLSTGPIQEKEGPLGGKTWDECIIIGPWGGPEGIVWAYRPTEFITKIEIHHGICIDSLTFHMTAKDGNVTRSPRFGGSGGGVTEVSISSGEYITGVDMMVGKFDGELVITLISFHTNITTYGPFGTVSGLKISIPIKDGSVAGFYGRYGMKDANPIKKNEGLQEIGTTGGVCEDDMHFAVN